MVPRFLHVHRHEDEQREETAQLRSRLTVKDKTELAHCSAGTSCTSYHGGGLSAIIGELREGVIVSAPPAGTMGEGSSHHKHSTWSIFQLKSIGM